MSTQETTEIEEQVSMTMTIDNDEILDSRFDCGDFNSAVLDRFGVFTGNGMIRLEEGGFEHEVIKKSFASGMRLAERDTNIVAVHKNVNSDLTLGARFESFKIFSRAVAQKCGGNPNICCGWYGGSKEEICEILFHGFSRCREASSSSSSSSADDQSYGVGIHLSSAMFACDSAMSSAADESGLRHILMCRVILGKMETVAQGSKQSRPSSKEVDTGVDNLINPRRYIVWTAFMNSHIHPLCVVSFKAPQPSPDVVPGIQTQQQRAFRPTSPWMTLPQLTSMLSKFLPPCRMKLLIVSCNEFTANKITRPQLIRRVRHIAGDQLLTAVLKSVKAKTEHPAKPTT